MRGELVPARRRTRSSRPRARFGVSSSGAGVRDARVLIATPSRPRGSASALTPACSGALTPGSELKYRPPRSPASLVARSSAEAPASDSSRSACPANVPACSRSRPGAEILWRR